MEEIMTLPATGTQCNYYSRGPRVRALSQALRRADHVLTCFFLMMFFFGVGYKVTYGVVKVCVARLFSSSPVCMRKTDGVKQ
jgi:hypothetical protein